MRGRGGITHEEPPCAAEFRVHVAVRFDAVVLQRLHETVDTLRRVRRVVCADAARSRFEAGVVHDELDVGIARRGGADVARAREIRERFAEEVRSGRYEQALALGREIVNVAPASRMAADFESIRERLTELAEGQARTRAKAL